MASPSYSRQQGTARTYKMEMAQAPGFRSTCSAKARRAGAEGARKPGCGRTISSLAALAEAWPRVPRGAPQCLHLIWVGTVEDDPKPLTNFADNSEPWACIRWAHNSSSKQNRQAEYDRLTALPGVVRTWGKCPVRQSITHEGKGATKLAR